jgi:hypothetical protein
MILHFFGNILFVGVSYSMKGIKLFCFSCLLFFHRLLMENQKDVEFKKAMLLNETLIQ